MQHSVIEGHLTDTEKVTENPNVSLLADILMLLQSSPSSAFCTCGEHEIQNWFFVLSGSQNLAKMLCFVFIMASTAFLEQCF